MKQSVTKLLILLLISCNNESNKVVVAEKQILTQSLDSTEQNKNSEIVAQIEVDTTNLISPDYFDIPQDAYKKYEKGKTANWFITEDKKSKLYIVPYTDGSLTTAVLTEDKIPDSNLLNLVISEGTKVADIENSIKVANLVSKKGISLGLDKEKVVSIFGKNYQEQNKNSDFKVLIWESGMKESKNDVNGGLKPFVLNGLNHKSIAYFKKNKLIAIIYTYEVP